MKITFQKKSNIKDLFIRNYENVPEIYQEHIPPPYLGWISLKYEKDRVQFLLNKFPDKIGNKPRQQLIDTITIEQAQFLESEVKKWNSIKPHSRG